MSVVPVFGVFPGRRSISARRGLLGGLGTDEAQLGPAICFWASSRVAKSCLARFIPGESRLEGQLRLRQLAGGGDTFGGPSSFQIGCRRRYVAEKPVAESLLAGLGRFQHALRLALLGSASSLLQGNRDLEHQAPAVHAVLHLHGNQADGEIGIAVAVGEIAPFFRGVDPGALDRQLGIVGLQAFGQGCGIEYGSRGTVRRATGSASSAGGSREHGVDEHHLVVTFAFHGDEFGFQTALSTWARMASCCGRQSSRIARLGNALQAVGEVDVFADQVKGYGWKASIRRKGP